MEDAQVLASQAPQDLWKRDSAAAAAYPSPAPAAAEVAPGAAATPGQDHLAGKKRSSLVAEGGLSPSSGGGLSSGDKRRRGRPPGSGRRQLLAVLGDWFAQSAGGNFTPHVVTVPTGEDVAAKILSLAQKGPRAICVLSANGSISNVTLRQPGSSGGTLTYEGRFEIISLTGCFTTVVHGGVRSRSGGMSVSLAGPDGRMVGGGVAGALLAASPIQVVVGSFLPNVMKQQQQGEKPKPLTARMSPTTAPPAPTTPLSSPAANPEPVGPELPPGGVEGLSRSPSFSSPVVISWHALQPPAEPRTSPDMNLHPSAA